MYGARSMRLAHRVLVRKKKKKKKKKKRVPFESKKLSKKVRINRKSHSYFTALCIPNKRKGTPAVVVVVVVRYLPPTSEHHRMTYVVEHIKYP